MKTRYYTAVSLDGFIAAPGDELDWLMQFGDPEESSYVGFIADTGAIAMGSSTYEWLLRHHVFADPAEPRDWPYAPPCWVFTTRSLRTVTGADVRFVKGDVAPVHAEMRAAAGGKNVWIAGGGELAGQFHDAGLLDELILHVAPVTLGAGAPLFPRRLAEPPLRRVAVSPWSNGITEMRFEVVRSGS